MLFLRFNEGAIVKFTLIGSAEPVTVVGKVIKVHPDEVEIRQQKRVYRNKRLDSLSSADYSETTHIARHLIQSWSYAKVSDFPHDCKSINDNTRLDLLSDLNKEPAFSEHTFNSFSEDGFCRGNGSYCGDIAADLIPILIL